MGKNILYRTRFYLIGAIESEKDDGVSWRNELQEKLKTLEILWFDPCFKPFLEHIQEVGSDQDHFKLLRKTGQFNELSKRMKEIRIYDLSLVDKADAIIFYYDRDNQTCGGWEEVFWSNRLKRPTFVISKQGKTELPLWLFGCLPHKYFYNSIDEVVDVLKKINSGEKEIDSGRWRLLKEEYR